jgi:hypothetical protein
LGTSSYRGYVIDRLVDVESNDQLMQLLDEIKEELLSQQKAFNEKGALPQWPPCKSTDN